MSEILFIRYSLASFPSDYLCRTLTRRSYLARRKTSRPYETVFQLGSDPETILQRHIVNAKGANPAFREAPMRKHSPSNEEYRFDADVPNRLTEQTRLSIYKWNPGPRCGKEGAIEKHFAGNWHIITLQGAIGYLYSEYYRFYVTHYGGCDSVQQGHLSPGHQSQFFLFISMIPGMPSSRT